MNLIMRFLKLVNDAAKIVASKYDTFYCLNGKDMFLKKSKPTVEIVDLGLPSGTKWMKCNIGAETETDYGKFFQWGDTVGYEDGSHSTWETTPFNNGSADYDEAYFASVSGDVYPNGVLASQYDAAYQATDGVAHMPTQADFKELTANTTSEWVTNFNGSGVNGKKFTASNGNYIFIPANGYVYNGSVKLRGTYGSVLSSNIFYSSPRYTWNFDFINSSGFDVVDNGRCDCRSIRGVVSKS